MANDTFSGIAGKILLRAPNASQTLARDWVQSAFRDIVERRRWSWLLKRGYVSVPDAFNSTTLLLKAAVSAGSSTVQLTGDAGQLALWPAYSVNHVGQQFRIGTSLPIFTITAKDTVAYRYTLSEPWYPNSTVLVPQNFSVYQAYVALPSDFHSFVSVVDPAYAQPLPFNISVAQIDGEDPQRAASGTPKGLAWFDYYNGLPRYELWPHQRTASIYPMVYESRITDPFDSGSAVPALLPSDIILERALMYCALWPGPSESEPNPYARGAGGGPARAEAHRKEYERRIATIEKQDNEHMQQNVTYQSDQRGQAIMSGSWMQSHDLG